MGDRLARAALVSFILATVLGWTQLKGFGPIKAALLAGVAFIVIGALIWFLMDRAADINLWLRETLGQGDDGHHHDFAGVTLLVEDDGSHVWIDALGLQRVLGLREGDDVTASRTPGAWRRDERGAMWLRVDAVIQYLNTKGGRDDPRVQRLRRYLDRDVLYPAEQRRRRGG